MSTRRARIKAVTSLPPRRKNADKSGNKTAENVDRKQQLPTNKDILDKLNTSESITYGTDDINKPQEIVAQCNTVIDDLKSPKAKTTNASLIRNVFISPQKKSPRKTFATPIAPSPKHPKIQDGHKILTQKNAGTPVTQKINYCDELQISNSYINKIDHTGNLHKKIITTGTLNSDDEALMDGIVPLQPENHASKSIDLLKNDITSENVEGLFDPIIPLPSPSKVRPKLRPVPRLGPHRRNSVQGSASESEDESRRGLVGAGPNTPVPRQRYDSHTSISTLQSLPNRDVSRVRNDSICSTTSQANTIQVAATLLKEKPAAKKRPDVNRRMMASKRRRDTVKREALTMYDLIFYNPSSNPIVPDEDELKAIEENEKEMNDTEKKEEERPPTPQVEEAAPAPQIKLGPNGEIMLDETSLVIKRTESRPLAGVVREGAWRAGGGRYRRAPRSADWDPAETVRFYRALGALGTDFTLMAPLFPQRTRKELKMKFKKEEKLNGAQVDKALRSATGWDIGRLKDEFTAQRQEAHENALRERERLQVQRRAERTRTQDARTVRVRTSRASKAIESTMLPGVSKQIANGVVTAEDIVEKVRTQKSMPTTPSADNFATLTLIKKQRVVKTPNQETQSSATPDRISLDQIPNIPSNIETGSLVVLTVNDPSSPGKKMLQTYIANGPHKLTPVALPATFLNSVVGYMKKNSVRSSSNASSPLLSPNSVDSHESRTSAQGTFQSPLQRKRHSSYNITQL